MSHRAAEDTWILCTGQGTCPDGQDVCGSSRQLRGASLRPGDKPDNMLIRLSGWSRLDRSGPRRTIPFRRAMMDPAWIDEAACQAEGQDRRIQRSAANAVLTTVVDTWGRSWTPRCLIGSSSLLRWAAVDLRGPRHSPEKRTVRVTSATRVQAMKAGTSRVCRSQTFTREGVSAKVRPWSCWSQASVLPGGRPNQVSPAAGAAR